MAALLRLDEVGFAATRKALLYKTLLTAGHQLAPPELLFTKFHDRQQHRFLDIVEAQKDKLHAIMSEELKAEPRATIDSQPAAAAPAYAAVGDEIMYDDFAKLDLRTGVIRAAEAVPKADKLLQLQVDVGFETRTIVSGIAQHFDPATLVGQRVVVLVNLAPRKLRGVESAGMILMADTPAGGLAFVAPPAESAPGMRVS